MLLIYLALFDSIAAAQTTTTQASTGSANFSYVSDDGKGPASTAEVTYTRYRYDYVEDIDLGTDLGTSPQPLFSADLDKASLHATIPRTHQFERAGDRHARVRVGRPRATRK